jgi:YD repeat-containing protein
LTVSNAPASASPLLAANLTSSNLTYDSHGDITTLGNNQTLTYDEAGRHVSTTSTGSSASVVTYGGMRPTGWSA